MAFGRQMHHRIRLVLRKNPGHFSYITNIGPLEHIARRRVDGCEVFQTGSVGQHIDIHDLMTLRNGRPNNRRADESGTPRYK